MAWLTRAIMMMWSVALLSACVVSPDGQFGRNSIDNMRCGDLPERVREMERRCQSAGGAGGSSNSSRPPATGRVIQAVKFDYERPVTTVRIEYAGRPDVRAFSIARETPRIVIDFSSSQFDLKGELRPDGQRVASGDHVVTRYRYAQNSPRISRMVFELEKPVLVEARVEALNESASRRALVMQFTPATWQVFRAQSDGIVIRQNFAGAPRTAPAPRAAAPRDPRATTARQAATRRDDGRPVIVVDAGHGGRDPGAIGRGGAREKDVNLAVARNLARRLENTRRYHVVLTRADDRFLTLEERLRLAREAQADLFLSLHADSLPDQPSARGASVYTLSDRGAGRARRELSEAGQDWIGDVDLRGRSQDISDILFDLAQRQTNTESSRFAEALLPRLDEAGPLLRNSHRSAGFYVLLAPDVPAVLVEMGFLSNTADERLLTTQRHQDRLARGITAAIDDYFARRAPLVAQR